MIGQLLVELCAQRRTREIDEDCTIHRHLVTHVVEHTQRNVLGDIETLGDKTRMHSLLWADIGRKRMRVAYLRHLYLGLFK